MIRVFLVDDHEIVRRGVAELLARESDIAVVGEASTVSQAVSRIAATVPDIALIDMRLPDGNGIELCREIRSDHPSINCLILTAYDDDQAMTAATLAGASGYVLKDIKGSNLVEVTRSLAQGRKPGHFAQKPKTSEQALGTMDPRFGSLNYRERQILALIGKGMTNRQIGKKLNLAEKTVKNYVSGLLNKLGFESRTQAAIYQLENPHTAPPPLPMKYV